MSCQVYKARTNFEKDADGDYVHESEKIASSHNGLLVGILAIMGSSRENGVASNDQSYTFEEVEEAYHICRSGSLMRDNVKNQKWFDQTMGPDNRPDHIFQACAVIGAAYGMRTGIQLG